MQIRHTPGTQNSEHAWLDAVSHVQPARGLGDGRRRRDLREAVAGAWRQAAIGCGKWPPAPRPARGLLSGLAPTALQQNRNTNTAERVPQQVCDRLALERGPCSSPRYVTCCTAGDVACRPWLCGFLLSPSHRPQREQEPASVPAQLPAPHLLWLPAPLQPETTPITAHILFFFPTLCSLKIAKLEAGLHVCFPPVLFVKWLEP